MFYRLICFNKKIKMNIKLFINSTYRYHSWIKKIEHVKIEPLINP